MKLNPLALLLALAALSNTACAQGRGVDHFITGNAADVLPSAAPSTPGLVLMGGGAGGGSFDLQRWAGSGTVRYDVSAEGGQLTSTQPGGSVY